MGRTPWHVVAAALVVALLLVLHPPWRAAAVRTTTRYGNGDGVAPVAIVDTVDWTLAFAPLYARPRAPLATAGVRDTMAGRTRTRAGDAPPDVISRFERRYHVPEILRAAGAAWRDSVLSRAGIPSTSAYEVRFAVDRARLFLRLALLAAIAAVAYYVVRRRRSPVDDDWDHEDDPGGIW